MLLLRLVIDTNVLVSAAIKPAGLQRTVLLLAMAKPARFYVSAAYLGRVSRRAGPSGAEDSQRSSESQLLQLIRNRSHLVAPTRRLEITRDPDDNIFLECADAARADYLVTGNQKHFPKFWKTTKVITPREFISLVAPHLIK